MPEAFGRRSLIAETGVKSCGSPCGIRDGPVHWDIFFFPYFSFPQPLSFHQLPITVFISNNINITELTN
jgi:hypothetical protein